MATTTIGTGSDTLRLGISEDAWQGDALYAVSVDGVQVGGTLTASVPHGNSPDDVVNVLGDWAPGGHVVAVDFLNDAYGGSASTDRNLYVDGATYDGAPVGGAAQPLFFGGPVSFGLSDATPLPVATVGSGPDTLALRVSEDAWQGDAQFTVSVDGTQVGGVLTATAAHGSGASDTVDVLGRWGAGPHTVTVNFLNDAYGGSASTDRNLYVDGATYDGVPVGGAAQPLFFGGPVSFGLSDPGNTVTWSSGTIDASQLDPSVGPGDRLIIRNNATVTAADGQLAGVAVDLLGVAGSSTANLVLSNAAVGAIDLTSLGNVADARYAHVGHVDVHGRASVTGGASIGEDRPAEPGFLDVFLHGADAVLALNGASLQGASTLTVNGDAGAAVENNGTLRVVSGYNSGTVNIQADLRGTGTVSAGIPVAQATSVELGGAVGDGQTIDLTHANLRLDQPPLFAGTLTGFGPPRAQAGTLALAHETVTAVSFQQLTGTGGDLSVFTRDPATGAAGATLTFHVAGSYAPDAFAFTNGTTAGSALINLAPQPTS